MAGSMHGHDRRLAEADLVAIDKRAPCDAVHELIASPYVFREQGPGMHGGDRRNAGGVIRMAVCHEYRLERRSVLGERPFEGDQMIRMADASIDENRRAS